MGGTTTTSKTGIEIMTLASDEIKEGETTATADELDLDLPEYELWERERAAADTLPVSRWEGGRP
jgi:hypothetical protein